MVYRSAEPHPLYDGEQRERKHIYLEAGRVQDPGDRRQRAARHPWGVIRDLKTRDWTSTQDPKVIVALLDSLDEAVAHLLAYMERWPAKPVRGPLRGSSEDAYQGQALLHTLHYALSSRPGPTMVPTRSPTPSMRTSTLM